MKQIKLYQSPVVFNEEDHTYMLGNKCLQGITGTLIHRAYPDTYKGISKDTLRNAADNGQAMHKAIQEYEEAVRNGDFFLPDMDTQELKNYLKLREEFHIEPIANEYLVSDEEHYASSIDEVAFVDGDLAIIDFKRTATLHKPNVALQCSIYKRLFELHNDREVKHLYVMRLRNEVFEFVELEQVDDAFIDNLIADDIEGKPITNVVPEAITSNEDRYIEICQQIDALTAEKDKLKEAFCEEMKDYYQKSIDTGRVLYTIKESSERDAFDTTRFKKEHADIYSQYVVKQKTKGSFTVKIR